MPSKVKVMHPRGVPRQLDCGQEEATKTLSPLATRAKKARTATAKETKTKLPVKIQQRQKISSPVSTPGNRSDNDSEMSASPASINTSLETPSSPSQGDVSSSVENSPGRTSSVTSTKTASSSGTGELAESVRNAMTSRTPETSNEREVVDSTPLNEEREAGATHSPIQSPVGNENGDYMTSRREDIPPVIIANDFSGDPVTLLTTFKNTHNPLEFNCKRLMSGFGVKTYTNRDYSSLIRYLEQYHVPFHLVQAHNEKVIKAVVKGLHPRTNPNTVKEELIRLDFPVRNTVVMYDNYRKTPNGLFLITLHDTDKARTILNVTSLLFTSVRVEKYLLRPTPPQCTCCWRFGHTARQCKAPPRCRKCAGQHVTSACTMPVHFQKLCVNCQGQHPATYRGCKAYIAYKNLYQKRNRIVDNSAGNARPAPPVPTDNTLNFPPLRPPQATEAEQVINVESADAHATATSSNETWQVARGKKGKRPLAPPKPANTAANPCDAINPSPQNEAENEEVFILTSQPGTSTDYRRPTFSQVASAPPQPRLHPQSNREWANAFKKQALTWDPRFTLSLLFQVLEGMSEYIGHDPYLSKLARTIRSAMEIPTRQRKYAGGRKGAKPSW